ncbi:hypothetical protein D9619_001990 [Psilocybe cf. subviscida]|uniref:Thiaminase-2/PQQC domain-containing protein n=1 Tax=Psilocybe cf. subviscida TaxID=2480587 RepID=A0A8H5BC82_9AGAR|nr:hypothetical protein D9619_001990 [Psilocybe cf. subviscida]
MLPPSQSDRLVSHAELFFSYAEVDARLHEIPILLPGKKLRQAPIDTQKPDAVDTLIKRNKKAWDAYISHKFPPMVANGSLPLDGFRNYMIQDKLYLETYLRVRMMSVSTAQSFQTVSDFTAKSATAVKYVQQWTEICVKELGISHEAVENATLSPQLQASRDFYTTVARDDDWFAMHVALLPCVVGYYDLAEKILSSPNTQRNTPYHPLWTIVNADSYYIDSYRRFLNDNLERYRTPEAEARWDQLFRQACLLETAFFDNALSSPAPFNIVKDGICVIRHFGTGDVLDVYSPGQVRVPKDFDIGDIGDVLPPTLVIDAFGQKVKLPDGKNTLVTSSEYFAKNYTWKIRATSQGYVLQNVNTQQYIKFEGDRKRPSLSTSPAYWWINVVSTMPDGKKTYQFMADGHLQFCFDVEGLSFIPGGFDGFDIFYRKPPPFHPITNSWPLIVGSVISSNNYKGSSQMWTFEFQ